MLPLYDRLGMDRRILACAASLAAGVNVLPWTGPTLRAAAALKMPVMEIFRPLVGVQLAGLAFVFAACWWMGRREERRLAASSVNVAAGSTPPASADPSLQRPRLFIVNLLLTGVILGAMILSPVPPVVLFMVGTALALLINYPNAADQRDRVDAHARAALLMAGVLLAAGAFTGIMSGSGMLKGHGRRGRGGGAAGGWQPHSVCPVIDCHAAQPGIRPGQLLLRCVAGRGADGAEPWRHGDADSASSACWGR